MSAARGRDLVIKMNVQHGGSDPFVGTTYHVGGRSYNHDDLVALALAEHLLGQPNPVEHSFITLTDPLAALPTDLSEEVIRPITRVLLTEALVGRGHIGRITAFRLGVPMDRTRHLMLEWEEAGLHRNPPERRRIEGLTNRI
jgi:hypothetical protein